MRSAADVMSRRLHVAEWGSPCGTRGRPGESVGEGGQVSSVSSTKSRVDQFIEGFSQQPGSRP